MSNFWNSRKLRYEKDNMSRKHAHVFLHFLEYLGDKCRVYGFIKMFFDNIFKNFLCIPYVEKLNSHYETLNPNTLNTRLIQSLA